MWWRAPKASALILNQAILLLYELLLKYRQDNDKAAEEWHEMAKRGTRPLIDQMFNLAEMLMSKSVSDVTYLVDTAWSAFLNQKPTSLKYFPSDAENVEKIVWTWEDCIICSNAHTIFDQEILKDLHLENVATGVFELTTQMCQDHVGNQYRVEIKDTKSQARGDPYCELTLFFHPVEES